MKRVAERFAFSSGGGYIPRRRIEGTVKSLPRPNRRKRQEWLLKVTDRETNKILEEVVYTSNEIDMAICEANELDKKWRENGNI